MAHAHSRTENSLFSHVNEAGLCSRHQLPGAACLAAAGTVTAPGHEVAGKLALASLHPAQDSLGLNEPGPVGMQPLLWCDLLPCTVIPALPSSAFALEGSDLPVCLSQSCANGKAACTWGSVCAQCKQDMGHVHSQLGADP